MVIGISHCIEDIEDPITPARRDIDIDGVISGGLFSKGDDIVIRRWIADLARIAGLSYLVNQIKNINSKYINTATISQSTQIFDGVVYKETISLGVIIDIRYELEFLHDLRNLFGVKVSPTGVIDGVYRDDYTFHESYAITIPYDIYQKTIKRRGVAGLTSHEFDTLHRNYSQKINAGLHPLFGYLTYGAIDKESEKLMVRDADAFKRSKFNGAVDTLPKAQKKYLYYKFNDLVVMKLARIWYENGRYNSMVERIHYAFIAQKESSDEYVQIQKQMYQTLVDNDCEYVLGPGLYSINRNILK